MSRRIVSVKSFFSLGKFNWKLYFRISMLACSMLTTAIIYGRIVWFETSAAVQDQPYS